LGKSFQLPTGKRISSENRKRPGDRGSSCEYQLSFSSQIEPSWRATKQGMRFSVTPPDDLIGVKILDFECSESSSRCQFFLIGEIEVLFL